MMVDHLCKKPPHYIRLAKQGSGKKAQAATSKANSGCRVASARWLEYNEERIFEVFPEALSAIHKTDRYGLVVVEADSDPALRHAYPYDHRVFVMPTPGSIEEVFRDHDRAMSELRRALDDTAAFASEIFGLFHPTADDMDDPHEERTPFSAPHLRSFLHSPLGDELATRIQLQPPYHGLVESDVVIVNSSIGEKGPTTSECIRRLEQLLERIRLASGRQEALFECNPCDAAGGVVAKLRTALQSFCQAGK